jgi:alcohol/geraniol dehydrogenase (NADP+)
VAAFPLIEGQKNIGGSAISSNAEIHAMLRFCAKHKISPAIEPYPMKEVNRALDRVRANRVRYRALCW